MRGRPRKTEKRDMSVYSRTRKVNAEERFGGELYSVDEYIPELYAYKKDYCGCYFCADGVLSTGERVADADTDELTVKYCPHKECPYLEMFKKYGGYQNYDTQVANSVQFDHIFHEEETWEWQKK